MASALILFAFILGVCLGIFAWAMILLFVKSELTKLFNQK